MRKRSPTRIISRVRLLDFLIRSIGRAELLREFAERIARGNGVIGLFRRGRRGEQNLRVDLAEQIERFVRGIAVVGQRLQQRAGFGQLAFVLAAPARAGTGSAFDSAGAGGRLVRRQYP